MAVPSATVASLSTQARDLWFAFLAYLPTLIGAILAFLLFYFLGRFAASSVRSSVRRAGGEPRAGEAMGRIAQYIVLLLGLVAALTVAGVNLAGMMVAVGAVGFGVSFAMQDAVSNFIAGIILLTTHPFGEGDTIDVAGATGKVQRVGFRSTEVRTFDGLRTEIPNKSIITSNLTINTYHPQRRYDVAVGVGYDDDVAGAMGVCRDAVSAVEGVLADPEPQVLLDSLGGSSVNLIVRYWVDTSIGRPSALEVKTDVTKRVKEALQAGGYDIPFPIRTVLLHRENGEGT